MILLTYFVADIYNALSYVDICLSIYILPKISLGLPRKLNYLSGPPPSCPPPPEKKIWIRAWEASETFYYLVAKYAKNKFNIVGCFVSTEIKKIIM